MSVTLIDDVTVFDGTGVPPVPHASVLLDGDAIRAVGACGTLRVPRDAKILSARGRFLMPGLVDFHTHLITRDAFGFLRRFGPRMREGDPERFLRWFPAFGVTTVRDIGNYRGILRLRQAVALGRAIGPRILCAGPLLEGPKSLWPLSVRFATPVEAAREVRRQEAMGVDWLKIYANVPPRLVRAVLREARRRRIPVAGHLGATTARQAAAMGIDSLEHASTLADDGFLRPEWRARMPRTGGRAAARERIRFRWRHADLDGPAARDLIRGLRARRVVVSPTMVVLENIFVGPERTFVRYGLDPMPERWYATWEGRYKEFHPEGRPDPELDEVWRQVMAFVRRLRPAHVSVIPGTDAAGWNPFVSPGAALHRDLALLQRCGYTSRELLSMATSKAAKALRREWEFGTIAPGRSADLLLLKRNPLEDLANLRSIETVVLRGVPYSPGKFQ